MLLPERSIPYKTFVKTALVLALREQFKNHPDSGLRRTKVSIDYPNTQASYPTIIVRFFEREITNMGVGHVEFIYIDELDTISYPFRHFLYTGDIEFAIMALSSKDRDLISDALVTVLALSDPTRQTDFFDRIYEPTFDLNPSDAYDSFRYNFLNLNTDKVMGFGETQNPAPWLTEDQLQYQSSYRIGVFGEFYSLPPDTPVATQQLAKVNLLPYLDGIEPVPVGQTGHVGYSPPTTSIAIPAVPDTTDDPAEWQ